MATLANYYINGATFDVATSVYIDSNLQYIAPDGVYKFGTVTREQLSGLLLTPEECSTCPTYCEGSLNISSSGTKALYLITKNMEASIGAIIIKFNPNLIPKGILATFNGAVYNKLSSPNWGVLQSPNSTNWTVVGRLANDCGLSGTTTTYTYTEKLWDGTSFVNTGVTYPITTLASDVLLQPSEVDKCVMVIPKLTNVPGNLVVEILGTCSSADFQIEIYCPSALPSFSCSERLVSFPSAVPCSTPINQTFYYAKVDNTTFGYIGAYDYVFTDPNGQYPPTDGYYAIPSYTVGTIGIIRIQNGVITSLTTTSCT